MPAVSPPTPTPAGPSDTVRAVVSFLLFLHLFAIGVAVLSRANANTPAPFETRLRQVPAIEPYIALTGLDWPYVYYLMLHQVRTGQPDWDHRIEVDLQLADGTSETHIFPDLTQMRGARRHRYEHLVQTAVAQMESPTTESLIPEGIARGLVHERQATSGTIRIRGKTSPEREFEALPNAYPPNHMYEARILVAGGNVSLFKIDSATDSAPAAGRPGPTARPANTPPSGS